MNNKDYYTTSEAAEILGVGMIRIQQLIRQGRIKAVKRGRDYLCDPRSVLSHEPARPWGLTEKKEKK